MDFTNQRILIVCPYFFDYHERLKTALTKRGARVDLFNEQPGTGFADRVMMRKDFFLYHGKTERYFARQLEKLNDHYDAILFIKCEAPTVKVLQAFRKRWPDARMLLYLWDSVRNIAHIAKKFPYFDRIFSFDTEDVSAYPALTYAYWGYTEEFSPADGPKDFDLCFVGTLHSVRPKLLAEIEKQCESKGLRFCKYVYMPHPLVYAYCKLTNPAFRTVKKADVHFEKLTTAEMLALYRRSKAVLEIENTFQHGATTRFGEMIGMQKKLVTTVNCTNEPCYRPEDFLVLDAKKPELDPAFFDTPYAPIPEEIRSRYGFDAFLDIVFG